MSIVNHLNQNKAVYMKEKSEIALQQCFSRCNRGNKDYKSLTNRQLTCIEYCSVKFMNAYAYAFDVLQDGGIARAPQSFLRSQSLK